MVFTLSNGYTYEVIKNFLGVYNLYFKDERSDRFRKSTKSFKSLKEVEVWIEKMNDEYVAWKNAPKVNYELPEGAYYSITGYYGD